MTSRARLSRRPLQVGGLLLATVALGTVTAPAASAMVDPSAPADQAPEQAPAPSAQVLTNSPASYLGTPDEPVDFGTGKLQVSVAPELAGTAPSTDPGPITGMAGAEVVVTLTGVDEGSDAEDWFGQDAVGSTATCTTVDDGSCSLSDDDETGLARGGELQLIAGMRFSVQQVAVPASGLYDLPPGQDDRLFGAVPTVRAVAFAPSYSQPDYPTPGSVVFLDPLATVSGGQPDDQPVAPGVPAPDSPAPDSTAPAAPVVPVTPAAAAPAAAAPTLATTGFDAGPAALVGAGLLAAGAGAVVVGRRRAAR